MLCRRGGWTTPPLSHTCKFVTAYLSDSWYITSKPIITLDFKKHTSSVPLDLVIGRVVAGRWNLYLEGTVFPAWT